LRAHTKLRDLATGLIMEAQNQIKDPIVS